MTIRKNEEEIKVRIALRAMEEKVQPAVSSSKHHSTAPSALSSHSSSSALCRRLKLELKRDEWLAEASAVKQRRVSEKESKLRKEKELVKILSALAATDPNFNILTELKGLSATSSSCHATNPSLKVLPDPEQAKSSVPTANRRTAQSHDVPQNVQTLLTLPSPVIPVFKGDPLKYRCFIREFKHFVEYKTECNKERLRYMLQFTGGDPKELVRSCLHMEPEYGYCKAKRLLKEHYGKPHKISAAYINKALNWPSMKSVDGRALLSFGLFLKECRHVMTDMRRTQELDCAPFMQVVFAKLPYRLRDYWGSKVRGIKKEEKRAAKFSDLVDFVNRHAEIALDPVYGYLLNSSSKSQRKGDSSGRSHRRSGGRKRFARHQEDSPKTELTPPEAAAATLQAAAAPSRSTPPPHSTVFDKAMEQLAAMFPDCSRAELKRFIQEFRSSNGGSLSSMLVKDLVAGVTNLILNQQEKNSAPSSTVARGTQAATPPPVVSAWQTPKPQKAPPSNALNAEDPCIICHEDMSPESICVLECRHSFHDWCIRSWLKEKNTCPTCRDTTLLPDFPLLTSRRRQAP